MSQKDTTNKQRMSPWVSKEMKRFGLGATLTLFAILLLIAYLSPFGYMVSTSLKNRSQITSGELLPRSPATFTYEGEEPILLYELTFTNQFGQERIEEVTLEPGATLEIYKVPIGDEELELAAVAKRPDVSVFVDPEDVDAGAVVWEGKHVTLQKVLALDPQFNNFEVAWRGTNQMTFPKMIRNTLVIAILGMIGTLLSSIAVAYAFARFPIRGKGIIFLVLISTIVLPKQVTLVPTYAFFDRIGWTGTWLPLIVPHFFANAYNVFLLRQYFRTLPRELDEAAMIDGAGPLRILVSVIIPQSYPAIITVALFHFVFAWNDYFEPLIYLLGRRDLVPISVGIQQFNFVFDTRPEYIQATALLGLVVPVVLFFFSQRFFMRGVVITGVDK